MASRFVVIADGPIWERNQMTHALQGSGIAWWHRNAHAWLLVDQLHRSAQWWSQFFRAYAPNVDLLVIEAGGGGAVAGWVSEEDNDWFQKSGW